MMTTQRNKTAFSLAICVVALAAAPGISRADLHIAHIFNDHMVLQQDKPVTVWGWATPGATVTIMLTESAKDVENAAWADALKREKPEKSQPKAGEKPKPIVRIEYVHDNAPEFGRPICQVKAGPNGGWRVQFDPMKASFRPKFLCVVGDGGAIALVDVLVGEVWLCSGQSNMQMAVKGADDFAKELIHGYYACVSYVDAQIGRVLDELDNLGLAENTIVVLWGDHGWNLGEHMLWCKHCTFETSLNAPLIVKVPGKTKGTSTHSITEYIDIYPSLCDLVGLEQPDHLDGESFLQIIEEGYRDKNYAVSKFKDAVTLIKGDLFYTEWTDEEGKAYARMLFDHGSEPLELNNLAEKEEHNNLVDQLAEELRQKWGDDYLPKHN